jgi:hypothetical protein
MDRWRQPLLLFWIVLHSVTSLAGCFDFVAADVVYCWV